MDTSILGDLFESILDMSTKESKEKYAALVERLKSSEQYKDPEDYHLLISYPMSEILGIVLSERATGFIDRSAIHRATFIYEYYGMIESHFTESIKMAHGSACCVDRSRWVIKTLLNLLLTGHDFSSEQKDLRSMDDYWVPHIFKSISDWRDYLEALVNLRFGDLTKFLLFYKDRLIPAIEDYKKYALEKKN